MATDLNSLTVMQYAIEHLKVKHVVVCGHYKCGAVAAGMNSGKPLGLLDQWLSQVSDLHEDSKDQFEGQDYATKFDRMCEVIRSLILKLNAIQNFHNVCNSSVGITYY